MAFDIDVLIVYADRDNEPLRSGEPGWVTQFRKFLELMLTQVLGEKPNVEIKSESSLRASIDNAAVWVALLSQDFIQSGGCLDHIEAIFKQSGAEARGRVFKVFKTPLNVQEQPPRLRELLGYEMYQLDPDSGEIREYTDYFSTEAERQYWMKMVDLAYDIYETLLRLRNTASASGGKVLFKRKTIYLAETAHDLSVQRNIIKRELQRHGYTVLPNQTLPGNMQELERLVRRDLNESALSIHLIGNAYGEIPEGSDRSLVDIQNKLAAEKSLQTKEHTQAFTRLIWISPHLTHASEKQKGFIDTIKRDVEAQEGAEILQTPLEDFKNIMREELEEAGGKRVFAETGGRSIYFMHDKVDHREAKPLIDVIRQSGFEVLVPSFEGDLLDLRQQHIDHLCNLDGAIIYQGKVNEQWVRMKALDLLKAPGFGRRKPIVAKAIVTAPGATLDPAGFKSQNLQVIEEDAQRPLESLKNFLLEFNA
ncbi:DUF4062 domain-containing protein [Parachryseolinea silvisoli]|jgi:hypothetical protein|uniref:DUF4062 domain-containing protein n=1 Tax=Parachryseolinea silvisoli TaxID=2873601 RepID=UPI002265ECFD|nr:DUF4062 domain-containing protein [Parachryseolinea silvisoli]MCD9014096.1 DUF4062 domain-containing protein [Parachryseolinea silvisoli]